MASVAESEEIVKKEEVVKKEEEMDDEAVLVRLREVLKTVNLDVTTEKMLRGTLETESGRSLSHLKAEIRKEVREWNDSEASFALRSLI